MKLLKRSAPPPKRTRQRPETSEATNRFSYSSRRAEPAKQPAQRQRKNFWLQRFGLVILLIALAVSAANILTLSTSPKVLPLASSDSQLFLRPAAEYEAAASDLLDNSIWNRNKITFDTSELSQEMRRQFPELSSVSVTIPLLAHRPVIYVEPGRPALILTASNGTFVVDNHGKALARHNSSVEITKLNLPILRDRGGLNIELNRQALPRQNVDFIRTIIAQLNAKQYTVSNMVLPSAASELDVEIAGQPYFVKFNLQNNNPRGQAGTFLATIASLNRQSITPAKYVDVRVDNRAYYQ